MTTANVNPSNQPTVYHWEPQPEAAAYVQGLIRACLDACPQAADLAERMRTQTGTRFLDWVDYLQLPASDKARAELASVGFEPSNEASPGEAFVHHKGIFPAVVLAEGPRRVALKVDAVADFLAVWRLAGAHVEGEPGARMRQARAFVGEGAELWVIERHGFRGFVAPPVDHALSWKAAEHLEKLCRRQRAFEADGVGRDDAGFDEAHKLVDDAVRDLGKDWACDLFFESERRYWQRRNRAARVQKARQDTLGFGWANHDHHTYRSSRHCYTRLIALLEKLGFHCRERFYAGEEAGWGAQVLEQPVTNIVIFADVDMSPAEIAGDFAHEGLHETRPELGTVGLWCALHGESMLQAGMHHLECQFDWHALKAQLEAEAGIKTMDPFTTFPFLRQAFTEGERWTVAHARIAELEAAGKITPEQGEQFRTKGAIGSHLENLERNDGYKGFNQQGVSDIISRTDPRKLVSSGT